LEIANRGWSDQPGKKRLLYTQDGDLITERSVGGEQYGCFLVDVFQEWYAMTWARSSCSSSM
jgi:uncharacterized protein